ncbi:MAG TPA: Na/Pi cotransporter family protein, partial [Rhodothermales bacterium]|nr:Na/Pi cotransporter family protein [Rhodothermales bacterium]
MDGASSLNTLQIIIGLAGGLALFLFGMEQMTDALKLVAGGGMKRLLARFTTNRFKAALTGAFVTSIVQSSSVTTVLVIGFISAGLMSLSQSIGFIMGANIGSTVTAQIIAFKVTQYALVPVAIGFAMSFVSKKEKVRQYGTMLMGLGLIFFGMELMSGATQPLRSYPPFIALMGHMETPALGILVSAVFTGIIQSSAATTGVVIVLASQGFITLEAGIALVFGANIGTCVTALLAAIGKPREAVQASVVHILFNIVGVVIWLAFIDELAWLVRHISPVAQGGTVVTQQAAETPRQIANAHTIFNVANTLIFIGFTGPFAWLVQRLVPKRPAAKEAVIQPRYLDDLLLDTPALALDRVRMELRRLGERAHHMVVQSLPTVFKGTREDLKALADLDDEVDVLHTAIVGYLGKLSQENLGTAQSQQIYQYVAAANNMENIGDMIETNIVAAGLERLRTNLEISVPTQEVLGELHARVAWAVQMALESLDASDPGMAANVIDAKAEINRLASRAEMHLANRLAINEEDRLPLYRIESEIIEYLKRVYYFAKQIAKGLVEDEAPPVSGT